jgi:GMP synthase-like glutamine amidotransferase
MILILSTCHERLSEDEFVRPVAKLALSEHEIKHYTEKIDPNRYRKIIICGTALNDNKYLEDVAMFSFLKEVSFPVLGICSGMQLIACIFGGKTIKSTEIGMTRIRTTKKNLLFEGSFEAYSLHGNSVSVSSNIEVLARSTKSIQAVKVKDKDIYGTLFHPEVRNEEIIRKFLNA